jgi:phospholipid/cholesterol/gamma-HCH transport system permease protein
MGKFVVAERGPEGIRLRLTQTITAANAADALAELRSSQSDGGPLEVDLANIAKRDIYAIAVLGDLRDHAEVRWCGGDPAVVELLSPNPLAADSADDLSLPEHVGHHTWDIIANMRDAITFIGDLAYAILQAVLHPTRIRWRDTVGYMLRCGADAVGIVLLICFLMGLILGFQAALQLHTFGADIMVADLVGLSITKELGPLMVAMICTGRAGSAFAAEIGTMKVSEEVDAMATMGLDVSRFLIFPKVLALVLVMPLLAVFGDIAGVVGGGVVGNMMLDIPVVAYWNQSVSVIGVWEVSEGLIKSALFALLISGVGCYRGLRTDGGAEGVGAATTSAVVSGIFLVIVADTAMTYLFTQLGLGL